MSFTKTRNVVVVMSLTDRLVNYNLSYTNILEIFDVVLFRGVLKNPLAFLTWSNSSLLKKTRKLVRSTYITFRTCYILSKSLPWFCWGMLKFASLSNLISPILSLFSHTIGPRDIWGVMLPSVLIMGFQHSFFERFIVVLWLKNKMKFIKIMFRTVCKTYVNIYT